MAGFLSGAQTEVVPVQDDAQDRIVKGDQGVGWAFLDGIARPVKEGHAPERRVVARREKDAIHMAGMCPQRPPPQLRLSVVSREQARVGVDAP